jgi:hypothetical protein
MTIPGGRRAVTPRVLDGALDGGAIDRAQRPVVADGGRQVLECLPVRAATGGCQIRSVEEHRSGGLQCATGGFQGQDATGRRAAPGRYSRECVDARGQAKSLAEIAKPTLSSLL